MNDSPLMFVGSADQFKNDKIFKMLEMDPSDLRYEALVEAVKTQTQKLASQDSLNYSVQWHAQAKEDPKYNPGNCEPDERMTFVAVNTYISTPLGSDMNNQAWDELETKRKPVVQKAVDYYEANGNFIRSMDIMSLPVMSKPTQDNGFLQRAAMITCMLENMHDLRLRMAEYFQSNDFLPAYEKN